MKTKTTRQKEIQQRNYNKQEGSNIILGINHNKNNLSKMLYVKKELANKRFITPCFN